MTGEGRNRTVIPVTTASAFLPAAAALEQHVHQGGKGGVFMDHEDEPT